MILKKHFNNMEERLLYDYRSSNILAASANLGAVREHFIHQFLRQHLGTNVGIGAGEIIDAESEDNYQSRNQMDIVVYRDDFPKIDFQNSGHNIFMLESVITTIEVKSQLSQDGLYQSFAAAKRLKSLKKIAINNVVAILEGKGAKLPTRPAWPHGLLNLVVAYDLPVSINTAASWITQITADKSLGLIAPKDKFEERSKMPSPAIDGIFILGKGTILFDNNKDLIDIKKANRNKNHWIIIEQESGNLSLFFMVLTNAISYLFFNEYLPLQGEIKMMRWNPAY